ncbi:MAG: hypothetical protein IKE24_02815 [Clostridia bacterium]|nr:hypothetical protein [Clostridia bacterium]
MKKIIAMILGLTLLFGCTAQAENAGKENFGTLNVNGEFQIRGQIPEGYRLSILDSNSTNIYALISSEEAGKPQMTLSIAFNDLFTGEDGTAMRLNDVEDEGIEAIKAGFQEQIPDAVFEDAETALGTRLLVVRGHVDEDSGIVVFYSVYQSYEVELAVVMGMDDGDVDLTEEQIAKIIDFLTNLDFIPNQA